jgi:hypothetical protein
VGFEPAITVSELSKTVHASDRSATATGGCIMSIFIIILSIIYSSLNIIREIKSRKMKWVGM